MDGGGSTGGQSGAAKSDLSSEDSEVDEDDESDDDNRSSGGNNNNNVIKETVDRNSNKDVVVAEDKVNGKVLLIKSIKACNQIESKSNADNRLQNDMKYGEVPWKLP